MKKRETLLLSGAMVASLALGGVAYGVGLHNGDASLFGKRGNPTSYTLTLDSNNGKITEGSYSNTKKTNSTARTENGNAISIDYVNTMKRDGAYAQLKAGAGYITNKTAISGIVSITVNFTFSGDGGTLTLTTGSSSNPSTNDLTITSGTPVAVGSYDYFKLEVGSNRAAFIDSIEISYVCDGKYGAPVTEAAPSNLTTTGQTTQYTVGDEFSYDGTATVHYTDGNSETCVPVVDSSAVNMASAGVYTVGLSYTVNGGTVSTSYDITVDPIPGTTYNLVTSTNQIAAGANYIIASVKDGAGFIASHSTKATYYLDRVAVTVSNGQLFSPEASPLPSFQLSGSAGAWKFGYNGQYLYDGGSDHNSLYYTNSGSTWSISVSNTGAANVLSDDGHYMEHYANKSEFTSFKTNTPQTVYLFTDYIPVELNLEKTATTVNAGHGDTINVTAEEGATVTVSSLAPSIAAASYADGKVSISALKAGNATINVTATKEGASVTKTISVTVVEPVFALSANTLRIVGSDKIDTTIQANATNFYGDVQFSASIPNQYQSLLSCTVDPSGLVTFTSGTVVSEQTIPVTITATDGEAELNAQITVTVAPEAIKSVVVSGPSTVLTGNTINLTATVTVEGDLAKTVNWTSSNEGVATVNNDGTVTGVSAGTTRITATSTVDGTKSGYLDVTVSDGVVTSVSVTGSKNSIKEEETLQLTATVSKTGVVSDAVKWSTSDADTATVSDSGLVTGVAPGSVTITATSVADPSKSGSYNLTVKSKNAASGVYTCNFESSSGFTAGNDYQGTVNGTDTSAGATAINGDGIGWQVFSGTWSTTDPISGSQSAQMRYYTSSGNLGYLKNTTAIEGITNVSFKGSCGSDIRVNYSCSDDGTNWTDIATNQQLSTSASTYNFDVPSASYIRISMASASTNKSRLTIDDLAITYSTEPTYPTSVSINDANVAIGGSKKLVPTFGGNPNTKNLTWSISGDSDFSIDQTGLVSLNAGATAGDTALVTVRAQSNAAGSAYVQDTATVTAVAQTKDAWTIMVYLCGSTLEDGGTYGLSYGGAATADLQEMASVKSQLPDDVNLIVEAGGAAKWKNTYSSVISAGKRNRFHLDSSLGWKADAEKGEGKADGVNMSSDASFQDFLEWGLSNYPAEKTGVIVWNHGGAMTGCCNDSSDEYGELDDSLLNSEVYAACETAFDHQGVSGKLEFIGYDCCLMQVQDVAEFNSHHFNYQVASEELENGDGWPYDEWLPTLFGGASTETVLSKIVDEFIDSYGGPSASGDNNDQTLSWLNLSMMSAYKTAWEAMALYLKDSVVTNSNKSTWINLIKGCKSYGGDDYNDEYVDMCVFDVKDFLNKVKANGTFYKGNMSTLVSNVETAFANLVGYSVVQAGAGNSNGLTMWYDVSHSSSGYSEYYAASETSFTNWRSLASTYYGS